MKHDYKFRVDEPQLSDEQIERHRNFDGLLADYSRLTQPIYRKPLYKNPRAFLGLVLILVIGYLVFEAVEEEEKAARLAESPIEVREAPQRAFLEPASAELVPVVRELTVQAFQDTQLPLPSGARLVLTFPSAADTTYPTDVRITELTDPIDMVLAGIPLLSQDGPQIVPRHLVHIETADNFPGDAVFQVEFPPVSNRPEQTSVLYVLDTATRTWNPSSDGLEVDQRTVPGNTASLNDGFEVVEYNEDGSVAVENIEAVEENGRTEWVRSYQASPGQWLLCGNAIRIPEADRQIQLVDGADQPAELYALYQLTEDRTSVRVYWPEDGEFYFTVAPGEKVFGFQSDGRLVWAEVPRMGGKINYTISGDVVDNKDDLKKYLGL